MRILQKQFSRDKKREAVGCDKLVERKTRKIEEKKKMKLKNYDARISTSQQNPRTKMLIDFDRLLSCSIKSLTVNKNNGI